MFGIIQARPLTYGSFTPFPGKSVLRTNLGIRTHIHLSGVPRSWRGTARRWLRLLRPPSHCYLTTKWYDVFKIISEQHRLAYSSLFIVVRSHQRVAKLPRFQQHCVHAENFQDTERKTLSKKLSLRFATLFEARRRTFGDTLVRQPGAGGSFVSDLLLWQLKLIVLFICQSVWRRQGYDTTVLLLHRYKRYAHVE